MPRRLVSRALLALLTLSSLGALPLSAQRPLVASDLGALTFRSIGPAAMSGRITDLAIVERDPTVIYAASATGGLWKTTDAGITWAPVFDREATNSIGAVAVSQARPTDVWVGTGEATNRQSSGWGDGVYKSSDGGKSWRNVGLGDSHHISRILVHPSNPDIVYVAAVGHLWGPNNERGLYKTTDGGRTWTRVLFVDNETGIADIAIDLSNPEIVYAASYQRRRQPFGFVGSGPGNALWKTTDGGATFKKLTNGLPTGTLGRIGISIYRKTPSTVYVSVEQGLRYTSSISYDKRLAGVYRSADRGESFRRMGDWNPRPAYSSRITVDPNDESRIYMVQYSVSDDSGKTFKEPRQTLHGDDRLVWVDPADSRHLVKADDGGVGISWDRGVKWLYVSTLPVSQWYHVRVDNARPYKVYGGLQDNGSWEGPSATYSTNGIANDDWWRVGGGDGFLIIPDTVDRTTIYVESQYLGLERFNRMTRESASIRPVGPEGEGPKLGNWGAPDPRIGKKVKPANWNAPYLISPHDNNTLYAGMKELYKSTDRGTTWTSLGDRTTGTNRRTLAIMGQLPADTTLSLDDGVSFWPTISALAESPMRKGVLWVGTDDGNVQRSLDGGRTFVNLADKVPGLPKGTWIAAVTPSRHAAKRVYLAADGHQADDYTNYLWVSEDDGATFTSIASDLPPGRVIHAVVEALANPDVLYLGTEFGLFVSVDRGAHWLSMRNNMPNVPVNDIAIQPRERDLVLATHGRGVWILDDISAIRDLSPAVRAKALHLFPPREAEMKRLANERPHTGDMYFRGENPVNGALITYWMANAGNAAQVTLTVHEAKGGALVATLKPTANAGLNRVNWNLRYPDLPGPAAQGDDDEGPQAPRGHWVRPGAYVVRLTAAGVTTEQPLTVVDDRRIAVPAIVRGNWHTTMRSLTALYLGADSLATKAKGQGDKSELALTAGELRTRIGALYRNVLRVTAEPTAAQKAQARYFAGARDSLRALIK